MLSKDAVVYEGDLSMCNHSCGLLATEMGRTKGFQLPLVCTYLLVLLLNGVYGQLTPSEVEIGVMSQISLYSTLYDLIFPDHEEGFGGNSAVVERFILQMPGRFLYPRDYDPGNVYEVAHDDSRETHPEANIPNNIRKNWFDLTDAIPTFNPFGGETTKQSFADTYRRILADLIPIPYNELPDKVVERYHDAMLTLNGKRSDPDALFIHNVTILDLYNRYRIQYHKKKLFVDNSIAQMKETLQSAEYNKWYELNYPLMSAEVEAILSKWRLYGEKEIVETNLEYLNTCPGAEDLESALVKYKAALPPDSNDRYHYTNVFFRPFTWYHHLIPK